MDTGLCSYLTNWNSAAALEESSMRGAILETFVVSEIIKSYMHSGQRPPVYFYRDKDLNEIDLLLDFDGGLTPIEIKKSANPSGHVLKKLDFLQKLGKTIRPGVVVCLYPQLTPLSREISIVPVKCL